MSSSGSRRKKASESTTGSPYDDERRARPALEPPVAQQRDQRRHEDEVVFARRLRRLHRLVGDFGRRIVEERHQQPAKPRIRDLPERHGDITPRAAGRVVGAACQLQQRRFGEVDVRWPRAAGHRDGRRGANSRIGVGQERARERRRVLLADRRERANGRCAHAGVGVAEHAADVRHPLLRDVAADGAEGSKRAAAHVRRLVIEEERRHEIPLVDRLEHVDRIHDAFGIRVRQLLHQRLDCREVGHVQAQLARLHVARHEALAERPQVAASRSNRHQHPQPGHRQAGETQLLPVEMEAPRLDEDDQQDGSAGLWRRGRRSRRRKISPSA